jgi:hypothetical protein
MSVTLTQAQENMVRTMGHDLPGAAQDAFVASVIARLEAEGYGSTTPQVRAAATQELGKGK